MDIHEIRSWVTLILIITFVLIVIWAYSRRRRQDFNEAANLPFQEPEHSKGTSDPQRGEQ